MGNSEGENYTELFAFSFITFLGRLLPSLSTIYDFYNFLFKELQDLAGKFWLLTRLTLFSSVTSTVAQS